MYSESKIDYDYFSSRITLRPEKYLYVDEGFST